MDAKLSASCDGQCQVSNCWSALLELPMLPEIHRAYLVKSKPVALILAGSCAEQHVMML